MRVIDPAQFYTGLVSLMYGPLRTRADDDVEPCADFIAQAGQPALELGCGDGYPLLELRERGLDVDGLDSSADMLARCRADAAERHLTVTLHHQTMEEMDLPRSYRAIFLAGPTFNLLPDDRAALRTLERIRDHLAVDGLARIPLFVPEPAEADTLGPARTHTTLEGEQMRVTAVSQDRDEAARTQSTLLRYELGTADGDVEVVERPWLLHWYSQNGFRELASQAGLHVCAVTGPDGAAATSDDTAFDVILALSGPPTPNRGDAEAGT